MSTPAATSLHPRQAPRRAAMGLSALALCLLWLAACSDPADPNAGNNGGNNSNNGDNNSDENSDENSDNNSDENSDENSDDNSDENSDDNADDNNPNSDPNNSDPNNSNPNNDNPPVDGRIVECGDVPSTGNTCEVSPGTSSLLLKGTVLGAAEVYVGGQVLVSPDGQILCAACDCSSVSGARGATEVQCGANVISPGLVNTHDHITYTQNRPADWGDERFEHRNDWRRGLRGHREIPSTGRASDLEISWGELRQAMGGTLTVAGSGETSGFLRNVDRGDQHGLDQPSVALETFPLGDGSGQLLARGCNYPGEPALADLSKDAYVPHVAEGIDAEAHNEITCLTSADGVADLAKPNVAFIHGIAVTADDGERLARAGTAISWAPRSNISLYGNTAPVTMLDTQGVLIGLGSDWTISGSINMLRELACADELNRNYFGGHFSDRDLWLMATSNAAEILAIDDATGSIYPGRTADIAIHALRGADNPFRAVIESDPGGTILTLRGGQPLYGDSEIVAALAQDCDELPGGVCGVDKRACVRGEIGVGFDELAQANRGSYDLFFCGAPPDEPTCVPSREDEYDGSTSASDPDGDGLEGADDNCPEVFNPARPMDEDQQADGDGDGLGDACDPCPIDAGSNCDPADPRDRDGDGVPSLLDVCPDDADPRQADQDNDGRGDACDPCPETPNLGGAACPVTIYDIKQGRIGVDEPALIVGVVTAISGTRMFVQVPQDRQDPTYRARFSGIFVFIPGDNPDEIPLPSVGDLVEIEGTVDDFFGQKQLSFVRRLVRQGSSPLPDPVAVQPRQVSTAGDLADDYEGVLITTSGEVTSLAPTPGAGDRDPINEFVLDNTLRVNDYFYLAPRPQVDDLLQVTGVLRLANGDSKVEPRGADDVSRLQSGPPRLASFGPATVYVEAGGDEAPSVPPLAITLDRDAPTGGTVVTLDNSNPARLDAPTSVTVPAGQRSVALDLRGISASTNPVILTAQLGNSTGLVARVVVLDPNRGLTITGIQPSTLRVQVDSTSTATLTLDPPAPSRGATITLAGGGATFRVPDSVTVEPWATSVSFGVDGLAAGQGTLTASAGNARVTAPVSVTAANQGGPGGGLRLSEVFFNPDGGDNMKEWVELANTSDQPINLSGWSLGAGGADFTYSVIPLQGEIPPGGCFVVGGPTSDATNASPLLDLPFDFDPDLQNSGQEADGVALFNVPADMITESLRPTDVVLYGPNNNNMLLGPDGPPSSANLTTPRESQSAERTTEGWRSQAAPSPNDCSPLF